MMKTTTQTDFCAVLLIALTLFHVTDGVVPFRLTRCNSHSRRRPGRPHSTGATGFLAQRARPEAHVVGRGQALTEAVAHRLGVLVGCCGFVFVGDRFCLFSASPRVQVTALRSR